MTWRDYLRGSARYGRRDLEAAASHFGRALVVDPENTATLVMLGYCYEGLERDREVLELMDRALSKDPYNFFALQLAGQAAARLGEHARGRSLVARALGINPPPSELPAWLKGLMRTVVGLPILRSYLRKDAAAEVDGSAYDAHMRAWRAWAEGYIRWCEHEAESSE